MDVEIPEMSQTRDEVKQEHSGSLKLEIVNKTLGHDGVIS